VTRPGEKREEEEEFNRVRRLHPQADEGLLRVLHDDLESRFAAAAPGDGVVAPADNVPRGRGRAGLLGSRASLRSHCSDVFRQAKLWSRLEKSVRASQFTFPGDPVRIDYGYRRNGTRGFVHTLSVTRAPADAKLLAYTAKRIEDAGEFPWELTAVTDVPLGDSDRHRFVRDTLGEVNIEPVPREGFAVWVAKLRPMLQ
jgi:hypothetical protein